MNSPLTQTNLALQAAFARISKLPENTGIGCVTTEVSEGNYDDDYYVDCPGE